MVYELRCKIRKTCLPGFGTRSDTNWAVQPHADGYRFEISGLGSRGNVLYM